MYLTRRFVPAVAAICLLIALSALAIVSAGDGFGTFSSQGTWLRNTGTRWKRDGTPISFPWIWLRSARDARDVLTDAIVTITVCAAVDSLPTLTTNSPTTFSAVVTNSAGPYNSGLANTSSVNTATGNGVLSNGVLSNGALSNGALSNLTSSNAALNNNTTFSNAAFTPTTSAYNNTSSAVPSCGAHPTSPGLVCQYYPPTIYATECSRCVRTSTVTNTYLSTISSCNATKISFIAAFTVTVTANLSASVTPFFANSSLIAISSKSIQEIPSLPLPTGTLSSSLIFCPNGTLADSPQDCALSSNTILSTPSSQTSQAATIFGSFPTSPGSALAPQTPSSSVLNVGNPKNSNFTGQEDIPTASSPISGIAAGTAVISNTVPDGGLSNPAFSLGNVSSITSPPATVLASASSLEPPAPSRTMSLENTSSINLLGDIPVESLVSSRVSDSQLLKSLPTSGGTKGPLPSFAISVSSGPSLVFPVIAVSPKLSSTVPSDINLAGSSKLSSVSPTQGVLPSIGSGSTAIVSSALPSITGIQDLGSSVASVAASVIPEISSAQVLISSAVSDITAAAGSVLPIATSISAVLNNILSEADSFSSSVLSPIITSEGLKLSTGNNPTAVVPSLTTSIGAAQPSVLSSINAIASSVLDSIQSLVPSIESDATTARPPITFSVPTILHSVLSNISPDATSALNSGQGLISSIGSDATAVALHITTSVPAALDDVLSSVNSSLTLALDPLRSLAPSVASGATTVSTPLLTSTAAVVNSGLSNGRPAVESSVPDTLNSVISNVNSISLSIPAPLHSTPNEVNGSGNILASIIRPFTSVIPSVVNAIPDVFGAAIGGSLVRDDIPNVATVTRVVNVVTVFVPSATPIPML